jgi:hypothetical protein
MRLLAAALAGALGAFACPVGATAHTQPSPAATARTLSANPAERPDRRQ